MKQHDPRLPHSIEAEEGVLGSCLIDPEAIARVADFLSPDDFYRDAHRTIYQTMLALFEGRSPADFLLLSDELEKNGKLKDVGGIDVLLNLVNGVPTSGNIEHYGRIVAEKALYRRLIHAAGEIAASAYQQDSDALEAAEQRIFALSQNRGASDFSSISSVLSDCLASLSSVHDRTNMITGVPTGFHPLDIPLGGLQRSDLLILAARPGLGKTSFALNVAANAAISHHRRVAIFSLEMSKEQLGYRLLSLMSRIDQQRLRLGLVQDCEWEQLVTAMSIISEEAIWIDDTAGISISALRSKARRLQAEKGIDLIVVDYLQLMHANLEGKRYANREQEIAEISRGLKALAKELDVPVLALAQLSRAVESRANKLPQLSDLRESGSIEQDADIVMFIHREEIYHPDDEEVKNTADIIIAKHRNGPVGTVRLGFEPSQTRFRTLVADGDED